MKIIRVFPRLNKATPTDELSAINRFPSFWDEADKVMVSVTFTWDRRRGEILAQQWKHVAPVEIGGPAYDDPGAEFVPGMFLKHGYTITSRGCPCKCDKCKVPIREGKLRLLPIRDGYDLLDNNILACPRNHIEKVFQMLARQHQKPRFTGGIEAARLRSWHVEWFARLKPEVIWMAYDREEEYEPLLSATKLLRDAGLVGETKRIVGCYVLMGWEGDTPEAAKNRLDSVIKLGLRTQAMWLDNGEESRQQDFKKWRDLRRHYTNAASVGKMITEKRSMQ